LKKELPNLFCAANKNDDLDKQQRAEVSRITKELEPILASPLKKKLKQPSPYFERDAMVAPTFKALRDQLDFEKLVAAAWKELNKGEPKCLNKGVFYVSPKKRRSETVVC